VADLTAAGDRAGAARTRLDVAYALRNADQWGDAVETAEEAQRSLDEAGLTDEATAARYLLLELYRRTWQHRTAARAVMAELLAAPHLPPSLPPRVQLLEDAALLADGPEAVDHLLTAADLHRAAGDRPGEARVLVGALRHAYQLPPRWAELVSRMDELIAGGAIDLPAAEVQDQLCRVEMLAERHEAALVRARRHTLRLREAGALAGLGRHLEAEEVARPLLTDDAQAWAACGVIAKSLLARGLQAEAEALLASHEMDLEDLDSLDEMD
jgi:hypothetical protein